MPRSLDDSTRPSTLLGVLESEQKSKEEAMGLATTLVGDVGVRQREKMVLEEQQKGEALVTFLLGVRSRFSDALWCSAWAAL